MLGSYLGFFMSQTAKSDINDIMKKLAILSRKSNLIFGGEGEDTLHPVTISEQNCRIIPVRDEIIAVIKNSKSLISNVDAITALIVDFIVTVEMDKTFTTEQFINLLVINHNPLEDFGTKLDVMRRLYLNEELIMDIDKRRQDLTMDNLYELSGIKGDKEDGWEERYKVNWDWVEYMNNALLDVSIITVPTDELSLNSSKYNPDYKGFLHNPWKKIHTHFIVGRTEKGCIIGYKTTIVWT